MSKPDKKKISLFEEFVSDSKLMIVDSISSSRVRLTKSLNNYGAKISNISSVAHYEEALEEIDKNPPKLIISDYKVKGGFGFELFAEYRKRYPENKQTVFVVVTSNMSQAAVAKAAEEDVDAFILKPYTMASLERNLIDTVIAKLYPSKYILTIEAGKNLLFENKVEEAGALFSSAMTMRKDPTLAHFYKAQADLMLKKKEDAEKNYDAGLGLNHIHFKCLVGLFELMMQQEKYIEAYDIVKKLAKYFPANPDRLGQVIRLAIRTGHFSDMEQYYELFKELDVREDAVIKYMCAGLYVCGKFFMQQDQKEKALVLFEKIGVSCEGKTKFLRAIVEVLADYGQFDRGQNFVDRFPATERSSPDFYIADFLANEAGKSPTDCVQKGMALINKKIHNIFAYKHVIKNLVEIGNKESAKEMFEDALKHFPEDNGRLIGLRKII